MDNTEILIKIDDGVAWVSLNRPDTANAAYPALMKSFCEAIDSVVQDKNVDAIVLTGEGRNFLAGGDFNFLRQISEDGGSEVAGPIYHWFQGATRRLYNCPKPTVAAVSGGAITVGCEVALACDICLVDRTAFFQESWLDLGLIPPLGGSMLLPRIVGLGIAKQMILEARRLNADEALRFGLASGIYEDAASLRVAAQARAKAMAGRPAQAFRMAKELIHRGLESTISAEWSAGVMAQSILLGSDDFRQALVKKTEKEKSKT